MKNKSFTRTTQINKTKDKVTFNHNLIIVMIIEEVKVARIKNCKKTNVRFISCHLYMLMRYK